MSKRMTVVFHDEALYISLKVAAARRQKPASDIIAEAVREWLESREDAEWLPAIETARAEWQAKGGRPWAVVEREVEEAVSQYKGRADSRGVSA